METAKPGQYLSFALGDLAYAFPISFVREINRVTAITPIPETPAYIAGVMNVRGKVVPIIDLRVRFGMPATPATRHSCIIIVDSLRGQAGLLVDSIHGVSPLRMDQIQSRPELSGGGESSFVTGMGKLEKHVLILVDVDRILAQQSTETVANAA
jgi:purine-binding chemotaxis protein CheW